MKILIVQVRVQREFQKEYCQIEASKIFVDSAAFSSEEFLNDHGCVGKAYGLQSRISAPATAVDYVYNPPAILY